MQPTSSVFGGVSTMAARPDLPSSREYHASTRILEAMELMNSGMPNSEVAAIFGVCLNTVKIWKRRYGYMEKNPEASWGLDAELFKWYLDLKKEGQNVTSTMITSKFKEINFKRSGVYNFSSSLGWVTNLRKRHGLDRRNQKKSSQMFQTGPHLNANNNVNKNEHQPPSSFQGGVQEVQHQNITDKDDLEGDDEILKELDRLLTSFQRKIIERVYESDEECSKRDRSSDDTLLPKAKMVAREGEVAKTSAILGDISPKKKRKSGIQMILKQVNQQNGVSEMIDVQEVPETDKALEEDVELNNEGNISDKEEQTRDDACSDTSSAMSFTESCDEKDEEKLDCFRKGDDNKANKNETRMKNCIIQTTASHLISDSDDGKEKPSSSYISNMKKVCPKENEFDKEPALKIDKSGDNKHNEDNLNVKEVKNEVTNSALAESGVILVSSGEDSDDDDDDVIFVENKCETIVIDASDGEGEKSEQEEHHQHSQFKIILLNTKEGGRDFSMVDSGSLESEPKVIVFDEE